MPKAAPNGQRGLTLIEVLVAISVLATMSLLVYSGLYITIRTQRRAEIIQERHHTSRVALSRMKRELSMAFISLHQAEDQRTQTIFAGERDSITFNTLAHEPWQRDTHQSDQLEVSYRLDTVKGERVLVRRVKYHIDDRPEKGGREEVIVKGVERFDLEYYDKEGEDWDSDWEVRVDDALEMRAKLKIIQEVRDKAEEVREDEATGIAGVGVGAVLDKAADDAEEGVTDNLFLPNRVRIRLELSDDEGGKYIMETQAEIRVTEPLWF